MANIGFPEIAALLKEDFKELSDLEFKKQPGWSLLNKDQTAGGSDMKYPIETQTPQGVGQNVAGALAAMTGGVNLAWQLTTKTLYSLAQIDAPTWRSSVGDAHSFVPIVRDYTMRAAKAHMLELCTLLYGDGTGIIGQALSTVSAGAFQLTNATDATRFYIGMTLQSGTSAAGTSPNSNLGYVIRVDYNTGAIVVSASQGGAPGTPTDWTQSGLYFNRNTLLNKALSGLTGWLLTGAPAVTDNWYSVNRSQDSKLYGVYHDGSGGASVADTLLQLNSKIFNLGGNPTLCLVTNRSFNAMIRSFQGTVPYEMVTNEAGVGFRSIVINGDTGPVNVVADRNMNAKQALMLDMDTIDILSVGESTGMLKYPSGSTTGEGDQYYIVLQGEDAFQIRIGGQVNVVVKAPGFNGRASLPN